MQITLLPTLLVLLLFFFLILTKEDFVYIEINSRVFQLSCLQVSSLDIKPLLSLNKNGNNTKDMKNDIFLATLKL